ncbi:hypothetical protein L798_04271 [Zootermopsis nevadensis]|uniref:Uncharacterized protein n=1 Tax=Zootermopsis nevadensis TaxID=136037 RepID=A0A067RC12_ZOONE|nr:hypothetical protein L798_04271 [Zootermopsis nevadensis]
MSVDATEVNDFIPDSRLSGLVGRCIFPDNPQNMKENLANTTNTT